jgi:hypothetical protein
MAHLKDHWRSGSAFPRHPAAEAKILEPDLYVNVSGSREGEFPNLETPARMAGLETTRSSRF